jgi:hypothetical protein
VVEIIEISISGTKKGISSEVEPMVEGLKRYVLTKKKI